MSWDLENLANQKSGIIAEQVQTLMPELATSTSLSRKVIRVYQAFPQLTSVLVGMRTPAYVIDSLHLEEPLSEAQGLETLLRLQRYRS